MVSIMEGEYAFMPLRLRNVESKSERKTAVRMREKESKRENHQVNSKKSVTERVFTMYALMILLQMYKP